MPRGDGTGPMGHGPFTGWGRDGNRAVRPRIGRRGLCWTYDLAQAADRSVAQQETDWLEKRLAYFKGLDSGKDKE